MNLLALLAEKRVIDEERRKRIEQLVAESNISAERALVEDGVDANVIRTTLGEYFDLPTRSIEASTQISQDVLRFFPIESARYYGVIPLELEDGVLIVGIVDPENLSFRDPLNFITTQQHIPYKLVLILEQDFEQALKSYESLTEEVGSALDVLVNELDDKRPVSEAQAEQQAQQESHIQEDAPVTKIVATILRYAVDGEASDIHIEPRDGKTIVRFRVDGVLVRSLELPATAHQAVVARIKILASLRLDERRKPQDGRFSASIDNRQIDFRVSTLPTSHGEKVVMRILDTEAGVRTLEDTGVSPHNVELIRKAIAEPYGIILISGPTGSGKSTTLYAMLLEVDRAGLNVVSLEDPVEYSIEGVSQSQVRPEIGYTFANGLRTALRQDPDVIMVGEIRDKETAQLAIQAALTGHLVLSTIHTNNAAGVVPRLIDMGIDPYLIAPTLRLALAQRLVRRICPGTGRKMPVEGSIKSFIDKEFADLPAKYRGAIPKGDDVLFAEPSPDCSSGTKGRVAVMEAIAVDDAIEHLILKGADEDTIRAAARQNGFISMKEDAIIKALAHVIPFDEVDALGGASVADEPDAPSQPADATTSPEAGATPVVDVATGEIEPPVDNQKIVL